MGTFTSRGMVAVMMACLPLGLLAGCAAPEESSEAESQVDEVREKNIDFRLWDAPQDIVLDELISGEVAYGECDSVEPTEEDVDIQINCGPAWAEVAWYRLPGSLLVEPLAAGARQLSVRFGEDGRIVRASIHVVLDSGKTKKLAASAMLFAGDDISAEIAEPLDHYVYVARGRSIYPFWGTGTTPYALTVSAQ
jgi:hypothetical protein